MQAEVRIFEQPSGNVRGTVAMFVPIRGKQVRIAHAFLLIDEAPDIGTYVPKRLTLEEVEAVFRGMAAFTEKLRSLATE
jgi:hypothetical protein